MTWRVCDAVRFRVVGDEAVVIQQDRAEVLVLNDVGAAILQGVSLGQGRQQILASLLGEYDCPVGDLQSDVDAFVAELLDAGVLVESSAADDSGVGGA